MKISIQTLGTLGDVLPFLTLAKALESAGHTVTLLAPRDHTQRIEAFGIEPAQPPGFSVSEWMAESERRGTLGGPVAFFRDWPEMIRPHIEDVLERSLEAARGADLVLANPIAMPARIAAEHGRQPFVLMALQPVITPTFEHPCAMIAHRQQAGWVNKASYLAMSASLVGLGLATYRQRARLVPTPRSAFWRLNTHLGRPLTRITAVPAALDIDRPTDFGPASHWVDYPPLASPDTRLDPELMRFLDAGPPPIHLGLGSMPPDELSHDLPVWLSRIEALGHRALVSRTLAGRASGMLGRHHVYDQAPHDVLFPKCRLVIHHGGAGTLDTAARAGVPQLVLPQILDQFWNAHQLARTGLTPPPVRGPRSGGEIDQLLREALSATALHRAEQVAKTLAKRQPLDDLVRIIEAGANLS